jgi:hypothetical protein
MDKAIGLPADGNFGAAFGATWLTMLTDRSSIADFCHRPDIKFTIEPSGAPANRLKPARDDWQQI